MHTRATTQNLVRKYHFTIPILPKVKMLLYLSYPAGSQKMMTEWIRWDERASTHLPPDHSGDIFPEKKPGIKDSVLVPYRDDAQTTIL